MSSTCSVLPRDLVSVEVAAEELRRPPSDLVDQRHDSGALTDACTRKGRNPGRVDRGGCATPAPHRSGLAHHAHTARHLMNSRPAQSVVVA